MSSELLASGVDNLKGHLAGAFNVLTGSSGDYTDLGIGRKFGGAAAAYSLRDVGAMNGPVVRVRRDSDNSEQDFSALAVPFIPEWCNRQVIKPLDVRELVSGSTNDGRTGDFIIAKAAYSLRSLGDRQATIANDAAPLNEDTVVPASGKYVVQVRRSSDDTIKSFTADEVTDGTLVNFVNTSVSFQVVKENFFSTASSGTTESSASKTGFNSTTDGTGSVDIRAGRDNNANGNAGQITFSFTVDSYELSGTTNLQIYFPTQASGGYFTIVSFNSAGTYTGTFDVDGVGASTILRFRNSTTQSSGLNFSVSNIVFTQTKASGFVRTWYDQSVSDQAGSTATGNHAVQTTADNQPIIVSNGSLLADGIDFDGTDDFLELTSVLGAGANQSIFVVQKSDDLESSSASTIFDNRDSSGQGSSVLIGFGNFIYLVQSALITAGSSNLNENILTSINNSSNTSAGLNGTLTAGTAGGTIANSGDEPRIGARSYSTAANFYDGSIKEIITYNTDQTDNRGAFEANIASHYGITAIPTAADPPTVNGFVETWYDQSGNANNAVQATATEQPKIVSSGVLLTDGIEFDGTNDTFNTSSGLAFTSSDDLSVFSVINQDSTSGQNPVISQSDGTGTGRSFIEGKDGDITSFIGGSLQTFGTIGTTESIVTVIYDDSANTLDVFKDGSQSGSQKTSITAEAASGVLNIGENKASSQFFDGHINEIILYLSDQTSDRADIESNIANHYGITLS